MAARELVDFLENGNIQNSVNLPNVTMCRSGDLRLGIIHRNIPPMISGISNLLSEVGANIENLTNRARGEYAYTLVDLAGEIPAATLDRLQQIDGVVRVTAYR